MPSVRVRPCGYGAAFCLSSRVRPCVSVEAVCPRFARWACNSGGAFCHRFVPDLCNSIVAFCLSSRMTSRFWRAVCPRFTPGLAALLPRFASVRARPCSSIAAFCLGSRPALQLYCGVLPSFTPVFFPLSGKKEAACGILRSCSAGSRSPFVRSRCVSAVIGRSKFTSGLAVYLWRSRRSYRGRGATRADGAAFVHLCAAVLALQCFPRGVRWGCAPQTAPKSLRLSGLSSWG